MRPLLAHAGAVARRIRFADWQFHVDEIGSEVYLQVRFEAPCSKTGVLEEQQCRKWLLEDHMDVDAIVRTAFLAVMTALEHEAREHFRLDGDLVFDPHSQLALTL